MVAPFVDLLGDRLQAADGTIVRTSDVLADKKAVAIFFSAGWCSACQHMTPRLVRSYTEHLKEKGLEVVFVSSDYTEEAFEANRRAMPWPSLPYRSGDVEAALRKRLDLHLLPSLVILDPHGRVIRRDGRTALAEDPTGEEFPWRPDRISRLLARAAYLDGTGRELGLDDVVHGRSLVGLLFGGAWNPVCTDFVSVLRESYLGHLRDQGVEVIQVSSDEFPDIPWVTMRHSKSADIKLMARLSATLGIDALPALVMLDRELRIITRDGCAALRGDPKGERLPWYPNPIKDCADGPGLLNSARTLVVFCETQDVAQQQAIEAALRPTAERYLEQWRDADGGDLQLSVMLSKSVSAVGARLRQMASLPEVRPMAHCHPLEESHAFASEWECDGCGGKGDQWTDRWRCSRGCDFSYCAACHQEAKRDHELLPAVMAVFDVRDDGAFYLAPPNTGITEASVQRFLTDFDMGRLKRNFLMHAARLGG